MELVNIPNYYEELIDKIMIEEVSGLDEEIKSTLLGLDLSKKRLAILSILDKNRSLFLKTRDLILQNKISKTEHIKNIVTMLREYVKVGDVEKKKFGEVMTPIELVEEMLDQLPLEVWSNPDLKWLDPANGCGVFPCVIVQRLMEGLKDWELNEELRYKHIIENMIYVCELQPKNMFLYLCCFDPEDKYLLNIHTGSFLEVDFDKKMKEIWCVDKFDIIVGNPPYQDSNTNKKINRGAKKNLYQKFINKALDNTKNLLFITPMGLFKQTNLTKINDLFIKITNMSLDLVKLGIEKYFKGVGTGYLCYYLITNKTYKNTKIINHLNEEYYLNVRKSTYIPTLFFKNTISIFEKILNYDNYKIKFVREPKLLDFNKKYIKTKSMNNRIFGLKCKVVENNNESTNHHLFMESINPDNLLSILNSKLYSFINKSYNYDANLYPYFLNAFSIPKEDKMYSNEEIYEYFNLSQEEIYLIETIIK